MFRYWAIAIALLMSVTTGTVEWTRAQPPATDTESETPSEVEQPSASDAPVAPDAPPETDQAEDSDQEGATEPEGLTEPGESTETDAPAESSSPLPAKAVPADYQVILGQGWSFAVPPDWQAVLTSAAELGDASIVAQFNDSQKQTVVNLVTQDYDGEGNDYLQQSIATLTDLGFTIHTQQPITIAGLAGIDLEVSLPSDETDTTVRLWQRMIVDDATGFALTCGGPEANLEAAQPICRHILNSFQVAP
jgi:hypothetical protein